MVVTVVGPKFKGTDLSPEGMQDLTTRIVETLEELAPSHIMVVARTPYLDAALHYRTQYKTRITVFAPVLLTFLKHKAARIVFEDEQVPVMLQNPAINHRVYCQEEKLEKLFLALNTMRQLAVTADAFVGYWDGSDLELNRLVLFATQNSKQFYNLYP